MVAASNIVPRNISRFLFKSLSAAVLASTLCLSVSAMSIAVQSNLSWSLFKHLGAARPNGNTVYSPVSLKAVLSMLYLGAVGETKDQLAYALSYQGKSDQEVLTQIKNDLDSLRQVGHGKRHKAEDLVGEIRNFIDSLTSAPNGEEVLVANNLFADKSIKLNQKFLANCKQYMGVDVTNVDFASPDAKRIINDWVSHQTKGKIPNLIDDTSGATKLIAINALYFAGAWESPFDKKLTKPEPFYPSGSASKIVPMMHLDLYMQGKETKDFQSVELKYFEPRFSLFVILPSKTSSVAKVEAMMNKQSWDNLTSSMIKQRVDLSLPRFKMQDSLELITPLRKLGINAAFDPAKADFGPMTEGKIPLCVGRIVQKVFMEVNEEGTVAAVATAAEFLEGAAAPPPEHFKMVVDRPFIVALKDLERDELLFVGHVMDIQK